jgi:hypothetical protein
MSRTIKTLLASGIYGAFTGGWLCALFGVLSSPFTWGLAFVFVLPVVIMLAAVYGAAAGFMIGALSVTLGGRWQSVWAGLLVGSAWVAAQPQRQITYTMLALALLVGGLIGLTIDLGMRGDPPRRATARWAQQLYADSRVPHWSTRTRILVACPASIATWLLVWAVAKTTGRNW